MQNFARLWLCSVASLFNWKEISEGNLLNHLALWLLIWNSSYNLKPSYKALSILKELMWKRSIEIQLTAGKKLDFYITLMSSDWSLHQCGLSTGSQFPLEHTCLFWFRVLHRLQFISMDLFSIVCENLSFSSALFWDLPSLRVRKTVQWVIAPVLKIIP